VYKSFTVEITKTVARTVFLATLGGYAQEKLKAMDQAGVSGLVTLVRSQLVWFLFVARLGMRMYKSR